MKAVRIYNNVLKQVIAKLQRILSRKCTTCNLGFMLSEYFIDLKQILWRIMISTIEKSMQMDLFTIYYFTGCREIGGQTYHK